MFEVKQTYKDFLGNERQKTLYFHISTTRYRAMLMEHVSFDPDDPKKIIDTFRPYLDGIMKRGNGKELLEFFDWLLENSYGEIGEDGEHFYQGRLIFDKWVQSASYMAFVDDLFTRPNAASEFFNAVMPTTLPEDTPDQPPLDPEFNRHREEMAKRGL